MTSTHADNATAWRDLSNQLAPWQVVEIAESEREQKAAGHDNAAGLLNYARKLTRENAAQILLSDVPIPPEAIGEVDEWSEFDDGCYSRGFTAWRHSREPVEVIGLQHSDGYTSRREWSILDDRNDEMTAEVARQRAAALLEAADVLDRLNS